MNTCLNEKEIGGQPFPQSGIISKNKNLTLEQLKQKLAGKCQSEPGTEAYAYILSSVSFDKNESCFVQKGSAPNFQGDYITLCTCKHYMRSSRAVDDWPKNWIAGFTSQSVGTNYLFYLMQVEIAFESFRELWDADILSQRTKQAKNASHNSMGDLFRPLNRTNDFAINSYAEPVWGHRHRCKNNPSGWHNDIFYRTKSGKHRLAPLLVGNPRFSFLWTKPLICCQDKLSRGHRRYTGLQQFFNILQ